MSRKDHKLGEEGNSVQVALAGAVSGLVSRFLTAPLDVVKIRLQLQSFDRKITSSPQSGIGRTIGSLFKQAGITGFWRGNVSASWLYVIYNTTHFSAYRSIVPICDKLALPSAAASTTSGALAAAIATTTAYPFDLIRTRFAAQGSVKVYANFRNSFLHIYCNEGISGFYRGLGIAVGQSAPYMGLLFGIYESLRPVLTSLDLPLCSADVAAGAVASGAAKTGTYPLDLIRKRLQIQGPHRLKFADGRIPEYQRGFLSVGKTIVRHEGLRGLYRGLSIGLVKATPTSTISMWSYGIAIRTFDNWS